MSHSALLQLDGPLDPANRELLWLPARDGAAATFTPPCHGVSSVAMYYRGAPPPRAANASLVRCTDDAAMVEFVRRLRVYYVFRPGAYQHRLRELIDGRDGAGGTARAGGAAHRDGGTGLGLAYEAVHAVIGLESFGFGKTKAARAFIDELRAARKRVSGSAGSGDAPFVLDLDPVRQTLSAQLLAAMAKRTRRDTTRCGGGEDARIAAKCTVGAVNARQTNDPHPCLPGLPDDEIDLLFAALGRRAKFANGKAGVASSKVIKQVQAASKHGSKRQ